MSLGAAIPPDYRHWPVVPTVTDQAAGRGARSSSAMSGAAANGCRNARRVELVVPAGDRDGPSAVPSPGGQGQEVPIGSVLRKGTSMSVSGNNSGV
jgi:hypothetical protein